MMHQQGRTIATLRALGFTLFTGPFLPSSLPSSLAPSVLFLPALPLLSFPFTFSAPPTPSFPLIKLLKYSS